MTTRDKSAISLGASALIVIVLILIAGFGLFLNDTFNTSSTTSPSQTLLPVPTLITNISSTSTLPVAATSVSSVSSNSNLELSVSTNSTNLHAGQSLNITVSLFNPLSTMSNVSIPTSNGIPVQGFPVNIWGACMFPEPIEFVIAKGNYSLTELEQLSINSSIPKVVCMEWGTANYAAFQPGSDVANISGNFCTAECHPNLIQSIRLESNFTVNGYWGYPLNSSEAQDLFTPANGCAPVGSCGIGFEYPEIGPIAQAPFSPGLYTMVVSDVWGQVELLHFTVS